MSLMPTHRRRAKKRMRKDTRQRRRNYLRPAAEWLEPRRLLANDCLAAIAGVAFNDTMPANGMVDAGEELSGATINLWRDGGNGVFDRGAGIGADDTSMGDDTTNAMGEYRFDDLTANGIQDATYFVEPLTVGTVIPKQEVLTVTVTPGDANGMEGVVIDPFETQQFVKDPPNATPPGDTSNSALTAPEVIGGERDLFLNRTSSVGSLDLGANELAPLALEFNATTGGEGTRNVTWDGDDGDATTLDVTGLGGMDLTENDTKTGFRFLAGADLDGGTVMFVVHDTNGNSSNATKPIINTTTGDLDSDPIQLLFSEFTGSADLTDVGAIEMFITGAAAVDGRIDDIEVFGPMVLEQDLAYMPLIQNPDIEIIKTAGNAPDGDTLTIDGPQNVNFTYRVTNTGDSFLSDITVEDDNGTTLDTSDDFTVGMISGPLAPDGTVTFRATLFVSADRTNIANVTSNPTDGSGVDLPDLDDVMDVDGAVVVVAMEPHIPNVEIIKTAGDAPDGDTLTIDGPQNVTFAYRVINTGNTFLSNVEVEDDNGTPLDTSDDFTVGTISGPLAPGGMVTFRANLFVSADQTNKANVLANPTDGNGIELPEVNDVMDMDDATVVVEMGPQIPNIEIIKTAGDAADGDTLTIDGPQNVDFSYKVTNTGNTFLSNIDIEDNNGTPLDTSDDFTVGTISGPLLPGGMVTFTATLFVSADRINKANVTANPTDGNGIDLPDVDDVMDMDEAVVVVAMEPQIPNIEIIKTAGDAPDGDTLSIDGPQNVDFTYKVTNTGNTFLSDIQVEDDNGTPLNTSDDFTVGRISGPLAPGGMATFGATLFVSADRTNKANVTGNPTDGNGFDLPDRDDVVDMDDAVVVVEMRPQIPNIEIIKTAGDAPDGDTLTIDCPQHVTFTYEVTNTGTTYLSDIQVEDDNGTPLDTSDDFTVGMISGPLAPSATTTFQSKVFVDSDRINRANVTGNPTDGNGIDLPDLDDVMDVDDAEVVIKDEPASICGKVLVDCYKDGQFDRYHYDHGKHYWRKGELEGVKIILTRVDESAPDEVTFTDKWGRWGFFNLEPGVYKVTQIQPLEYKDGPNIQGTPRLGGVVEFEEGVVDDMFTDIALEAGVHAIDYNFVELPWSEKGCDDYSGACPDYSHGQFSKKHYHNHYCGHQYQCNNQPYGNNGNHGSWHGEWHGSWHGKWNDKWNQKWNGRSYDSHGNGSGDKYCRYDTSYRRQGSSNHHSDKSSCLSSCSYYAHGSSAYRQGFDCHASSGWWR